jgi:hypothetical protein
MVPYIEKYFTYDIKIIRISQVLRTIGDNIKSFKGLIMGKYFALILVFFFNGCYFTNSIYFDQIEETLNDKKQITFDYCANFSYISNIKDEIYGNLFIEYINLDRACHWNGLQTGFFEYQFKSTLKLKSFNLIERKKFDNYEFDTYLIDEKFYVNFIYKYSVYEDLFIIDYDGKYTDKRIKEFDKNYSSKYLDKPRFISNYSDSLVKTNIINSYFSKDKEIEIEK